MRVAAGVGLAAATLLLAAFTATGGFGNVDGTPATRVWAVDTVAPAVTRLDLSA